MALNPTIIKTVGGLTVVSGTGVTGYIYRKQLSDIWNADDRAFLVQATTVASDIGDFNKDGKYCSLNSEIDDDCQIVDLDFNEQKYVDSKKIINSSTAAKTLTNNTFYKLIVNRWKIKSLVNNADVSIEIKTGSGNNAKSIATLKVISTMYESTHEKPVDTWSGLKVLVQADKSVVETQDMNLSTDKCKLFIANTDNDIKCSVYKFDDYSSNKNLLNFSKIKKLTKFNEIQAGQYYIVDFDLTDNDATTKAKVTDENIKKIFIKKATSTNVALSFKSKIITNLKESESTYTNTQALLLNDFVKDEFNSTYIVVKSHTDTGTDGIDIKNSNYKCKNNGKTSNCLLIQLKDEERTFNQITSSENPVTEPGLKSSQKKYFKIYADNEFIQSINTWSGNVDISVVNSTTDSTVYKKFTPLFLIENGKIAKIKTPLSIATVTKAGKDINTATFSDGMSYLCSVGGKNEEKACDIYKFDEQPNLKNLTASLSESKSLPKEKDKEGWKVKNTFLVHLKENMNFEWPSADPAQKTIHVTVKISDSSKKEVGTLTVDTLLWNSESFTGDPSKLLILSEQSIN